jgi:biotin carboxylase
VSAPDEHRVLLLMTTTTYRATSFLEAAGTLEIPAVVGSDRRQSLASANPGGHLTLDFARPAEATREIVEFHGRYPIRAVLAADDDGVILAAHAAEALALRHHPLTAVRAARNKHRMREVLRDAGVASPRFDRLFVDDDPRRHASEVSYPCVLKPLHLSASRGVIRADDPESFVSAFGRIAAILGRPEIVARGGRSTRSVLVESFIPGAEVALEGVVTDGRLRVLALYDKPDPMDGPFFEETLLVTPSRHPETVRRDAAVTAQRAVAALGLGHGPVHVEMRINENGAWIVEAAPRSIGGLCSRTLRFGDGLSLEALLLRHALGLGIEGMERESAAAGVMMIPIPRPGVLRAVEGRGEAERVPAVEEVRISIPLDHEIVPPPEGDRYLGFIFSRASTPEAVETALREAHRCLEIRIE